MDKLSQSGHPDVNSTGSDKYDIIVWYRITSYPRVSKNRRLIKRSSDFRTSHYTCPRVRQVDTSRTCRVRPFLVSYTPDFMHECHLFLLYGLSFSEWWFPPLSSIKENGVPLLSIYLPFSFLSSLHQSFASNGGDESCYITLLKQRNKLKWVILANGSIKYRGRD